MEREEREREKHTQELASLQSLLVQERKEHQLSRETPSTPIKKQFQLQEQVALLEQEKTMAMVKKQHQEEVVRWEKSCLTEIEQRQQMVVVVEKQKKKLLVMEMAWKKDQASWEREKEERAAERDGFERRLEQVQQKWQQDYGKREEEMLLTHSKEMTRLKNTIVSEYENERQRVERAEQERRQEMAVAASSANEDRAAMVRQKEEIRSLKEEKERNAQLEMKRVEEMTLRFQEDFESLLKEEREEFEATVAVAEGKVAVAETAVVELTTQIEDRQKVDRRKEQEKLALMKEMKIENVMLVEEGKKNTLACAQLRATIKENAQSHAVKEQEKLALMREMKIENVMLVEEGKKNTLACAQLRATIKENARIYATSLAVVEEEQSREMAELVRALKVKEEEKKEKEKEENENENKEGGVGTTTHHEALRIALQEATVKRALLEESTDVLEQTMCTMLDDHEKAVAAIHQEHAQGLATKERQHRQEVKRLQVICYFFLCSQSEGFLQIFD
jgi:hypothetical protein